MSVWNAVQFCTFSIAEEAADMQSLLQLRKLIPKKNIPFSLLFVRSLKPDSRRQDLSKKEVAGERERERRRASWKRGGHSACASQSSWQQHRNSPPSPFRPRIDHFLEGDSPVDEHQCRFDHNPHSRIDMPRPSISIRLALRPS